MAELWTSCVGDALSIAASHDFKRCMDGLDPVVEMARVVSMLVEISFEKKLD
jgi:hypothetical protein